MLKETYNLFHTCFVINYFQLSFVWQYYHVILVNFYYKSFYNKGSLTISDDFSNIDFCWIYLTDYLLWCVLQHLHNFSIYHLEIYIWLFKSLAFALCRMKYCVISEIDKLHAVSFLTSLEQKHCRRRVFDSKRSKKLKGSVSIIV